MKSKSRGVALAVMVVSVVCLLLLAAGSALAADATYEKLPGGTNAQIKDSVFYIAVNEGTAGTGQWLYYYFTFDELQTDYGAEPRDFDYTNHTVSTITSAHGFPITKLIDSLVDWYGNPLPIDDTWSIQYLEEDAYHATGSSYIDTIANARVTTRPMLTYEIKETYTDTTKYNVNDADYHWAEDLYPEYLRVYRQTDSANSSVMKMMMGIAVSSDGAAYNSSTAAQYSLTGTDPLGNQVVLNSKGTAGRTVLGALAGMKIGVHAPTVAGYAPTTDGQVITAQPAASAQNVTFSYTPYDYVTVKDWTSGASTTYTEYSLANAGTVVRTIPESLEYVQGLVSSGEAAIIDDTSIDARTAEFLITLPTRMLFVDTRSSASTPYPYGYTDLNLYRYTGASAMDLAGVAPADLSNVVVTGTDGAMTLYTGEAAKYCFVAYKDSHSKACPNNTPESKRFTWVYSYPELINEYDGDVLVPSVADVDVNAPVAKSVRIRTGSGATTATIHRGKTIRLFGKTSPASTIEKLTWKSSRPGVAAVSATGKVTAKRTGTVTITVKTTFGKKATFKLTIVK